MLKRTVFLIFSNNYQHLDVCHLIFCMVKWGIGGALAVQHSEMLCELRHIAMEV